MFPPVFIVFPAVIIARSGDDSKVFVCFLPQIPGKNINIIYLQQVSGMVIYNIEVYINRNTRNVR